MGGRPRRFFTSGNKLKDQTGLSGLLRGASASVLRGRPRPRFCTCCDGSCLHCATSIIMMQHNNTTINIHKAQGTTHAPWQQRGRGERIVTNLRNLRNQCFCICVGCIVIFGQNKQRTRLSMVFFCCEFHLIVLKKISKNKIKRIQFFGHIQKNAENNNF